MKYMKGITLAPRPVNFEVTKNIKLHGGEGAKGMLVSRIWINSEVFDFDSREHPISKDDWGDYAFCAELIKWTTVDYSIRIGYFHRAIGKKKSWIWGQYTLNTSRDIIEKMIIKMNNEPEWYQPIPNITEDKREIF